MPRLLSERPVIIGLVAAITVAMISFSPKAWPVQAGDAPPASAEGDRVVAVLFSVGRTEDARKQFGEDTNLDLLEIHGAPAITHVYDALCQSRYVEKIIIVAAPEIEEKMAVREEPPTSFVIDQGDAAKNVQFGIHEISEGDLIMFIPSDLVLVTPQGLDSLIERVLEETNVDVVFPLIGREVCEKKYPEERRTYARFKEGQYTGAHVEFLRPKLFLEHPGEVQANKENLYDVYSMRKSTLGIVRFLGLRLTLKYIFGTLSPSDLEQHVFEKYEVTAKAIYWDDPDLATDLSEPSDIQMINRALEQRSVAHSQLPPARSESAAGADVRSGA